MPALVGLTMHMKGSTRLFGVLRSSRVYRDIRGNV